MNDQPQNNNIATNSGINPTVDNTAYYSQPTQPISADPISPVAPVVSTAEQLNDIKQKALAQLTPMVNNLDQSPVERYRTIMMMIQASDNQELIKDAYDAAQKIPDDKSRAQALLDIVNEINYFTQRAAQ